VHRLTTFHCPGDYEKSRWLSSQSIQATAGPPLRFSIAKTTLSERLLLSQNANFTREKTYAVLRVVRTNFWQRQGRGARDSSPFRMHVNKVNPRSNNCGVDLIFAVPPHDRRGMGRTASFYGRALTVITFRSSAAS
jgi:hypothetical protein